METAKESKVVQKARKKVKQTLKNQNKRVRGRLLKSMQYHLRTQLQKPFGKKDTEVFENAFYASEKNSLPIESPSPLVIKLKEKIVAELELPNR